MSNVIVFDYRWAFYILLQKADPVSQLWGLWLYIGIHVMHIMKARCRRVNMSIA